MLLWIVVALLTGAAVMAVLAPLSREPREGRRGALTRRVYLDQLAELERDRAEGRISEDQARAARAEIARRLIANDSAPGEAADRGGSLPARRATAVVALVGIPLFTFGLYIGLGAPSLPGQPLASRAQAAAEAGDVAALVAKVEAHLAGAPEDGAGWDVIAPVYLRMGRAEEAARAYRNAIRLLGSSMSRQNGLGEALLAAEQGIVTADARAAFEAASAADPSAPGPRFYLALAHEQDGNLDAAAKGWRALLAEAAPDAPWRASVEQALARVDQPGPSGTPPPSTEAAPGAIAADQPASIEGMVSGLAERLRREPDDVEGWIRLIRSYSVLGRPEDAAAAARDAMASLRGKAGQDRVATFVAELGLLAPEAGTP